MHLYPFFMNHHHLFPSDPFSVSTTLLPGGLSNTNEIPASRPVFPGWFLVKVPLGAPRVSVLLRVLQAGISKEDPLSSHFLFLSEPQQLHLHLCCAWAFPLVSPFSKLASNNS